MKKIIITYLLLIIALILNAKVPDSLYQYIKKANKLYDSSQYALAIKYYQKVIKNGYVAGELFYNIANAYFKSGNIPNAIYYYEKALLLKPHEKKIKENLNLVNQYVKSDYSQYNPFILDKIFWFIITLLPSNAWATISFILFVIAMVGTILFFLSPKISIRKSGFIIGIIAILLSVTTYFFAYEMDIYQNAGRYAIVMKTSTVRSSPNTTGTQLFILAPGIKVKIQDKSAQWYQVKLPNNKSGWINQENIKLIKL